MAEVAIITAAMSAASAGISVMSARAQNKAAESSARVALRNRMEKAKRAQQAAALETQKTINEAQLVEGRIRVATSEMGTASSQTAVALQRQATSDAWTNIDINQQNLAGSLAGIRSGAAGRLAAIQSQTASPLLEGFKGGISGAMSGMQLAKGAKDAGWIPK